MQKKKPNHDPADDPKKERNIKEKKNVSSAHDEAEKDMEQDPDLSSKPHQEDDLDEGELARLEGED